MAKTGRSTWVDSESQVESSRLDYNYTTQLDLADSTANTTVTLGSMTEYWVTTALSLATWIEGFI